MIFMLAKLHHTQRDKADGSPMPIYLKIANIVLLALGALSTVTSFTSGWYLLDSYFITGPGE